MYSPVKQQVISGLRCYQIFPARGRGRLFVNFTTTTHSRLPAI